MLWVRDHPLFVLSPLPHSAHHNADNEVYTPPGSLSDEAWTNLCHRCPDLDPSRHGLEWHRKMQQLGTLSSTLDIVARVRWDHEYAQATKVVTPLLPSVTDSTLVVVTDLGVILQLRFSAQPLTVVHQWGEYRNTMLIVDRIIFSPNVHKIHSVLGRVLSEIQNVAFGAGVVFKVSENSHNVCVYRDLMTHSGYREGTGVINDMHVSCFFRPSVAA